MKLRHNKNTFDKRLKTMKKYCNKKQRKSLFGTDMYITVIVILFCILVIGVAHLIFTYQSIETLKFSDEHSVVDTHLYVLLNNNYCTPLTKLPLKTVIGTALSKDISHVPTSDITINYNNAEDTLQIEKCISDYAKRLQIDEYLFYVMYNDNKCLIIGKETEDMSVEMEDIAIPPAGIATAFLKIKREPAITTGNQPCPQDDDLRCMPQKSCALFGGSCKNQYLCSPAHCCCNNLPV